MQQVPSWWVWFSGIYFIISILWSFGLIVGLFMVYARTSITVSWINGAVFAVVLYMIFAGGILTGSVFPTFRYQSNQGGSLSPSRAAPQAPNDMTTQAAKSQKGPGRNQTQERATLATSQNIGSTSEKAAETDKSDKLTPITFLFYTRPTDEKGYALLFVWSFLAGFAEQLVPDTLDRIRERSAASGSRIANPQSP